MASLRKETAYLYAIQISNFAIPLLTLPYLTKVLGLAGIGKLGIVQTIFFFMGFLIDFGFTYSASRDISLNSRNEEQLNKIYTNVQLLRFIFFSFVSFILVVILFNLNITEQERLAYIISVVSSFSFVLIPGWLFNGLSRNSILSFFTLIFKILTLVPIFLFVNNSDEYLLAFIFQNSSLIIFGIIILIYVKINQKIKFSIKDIDLFYIRKIFKESFDVFSGSALSIVYTTFVPFLIKISLGDKWVGIYVLVEKILSILKQMFMPIIQAFYAKICILYSENKIQQVQVITKKILILYFLLTVIAIVTNIIFGRLMIELFFNNQQVLFKYIFISIMGQFVVGLSIITMYGGILPSGNGYILKRIYARASVLFISLIVIMWDFLTLDLIYYSVIFVELIIVINAFLFIKNKVKENGVEV